MNVQIKPLYAALLAASAAPSAAWAVNAPLTADSYVASSPAAAASINYGSASVLKVIGTSAEALLRFDLSALPAGATAADVSKATLFVWVGTINTAGALQVSDVSAAWAETGVTYNTAPGLGAIVASSVPVSASAVGYYVAFDVTNSVKNWIGAPAANFGLAIQADAAAPATSVLIDSKESTGTSHPSYIDIATASGVASVGATAPLSNTGTAIAPVIGMAAASGSANGYLSSADWTTFNSKGNGDITGVTAGTGLSGGGASGSVTLNLANSPSTASAANTLVLRDASGNFSAGTITASLNGNASTATTATTAGNANTATTATTAVSANSANALLNNGTNCAAGQFPLGVDAAGNAESCTTAGTGTITGVTAGTGLTGGGSSGSVSLGIATGGVTTTQIADGTITGTDIANTTIPVGKISTSSGTASSTTYLRGDGTWSTPAGGGGGLTGNVAKIQAGSFSLNGSTSQGSATFATAFSSTPFCSLTPLDSTGNGLVSISSVTTTAVNGFGGNGTGNPMTVHYICVGN